jgi:hypothetical protein
LTPILLLANHIDNLDALRDALKRSREGIRSGHAVSIRLYSRSALMEAIPAETL